jgi:hypothetical protein
MKQMDKFYPEEVLIEKIQAGEFGWLEYIIHHSREWKHEFEAFCKERDLNANEESALKFIDYKEAQMDEALAEENA